VHCIYIFPWTCIFTNEEKRTLLDISHVSRRGASLRITLPKKVSAVLSVNQRDIVGFYLEGEKIIIEKMK